MDARLQALFDKQEIHELINAYCNAADRHDNEKMRSLYHEDAYDDHGPFSQGLAMDFIDKLPEIQVPMEILHHNVTTVNIQLDGDYAEGEVYVLAFHKIRTEDGPVDLLIGGRYFDKYQKRDGRWKFAHRSVVADWATLDSPSRINLTNSFLEGAYIGKPGAGDPSYSFFRLFRFGDTAGR